MLVIEPETVTAAILVSSSVAENDYPVWNAGTTYAAGARVIVAAGTRIFESVAGGNAGNDPSTTSPTKWLDIGPMNRWAMFDQAVGSKTTDTGSILVVLSPPVSTTVSVLDTDAASIRVRVLNGATPVYDQTQLVAGNNRTLALFHDLPAVPAGHVEVTASASGGGVSVSVGSLIMGAPFILGETEAGPSVGINDFSRRDTDDFGITTITERAWAKRMTIRSMIATDDVDNTQRRLAGMRAKPCLWVGDEDYDSLIIYGFFKEISIDLALPTISYCSISIEGLTTAGALDDPFAPLIDAIETNSLTIAQEALTQATWRTQADQILYDTNGNTLRQLVDQIGVSVGTHQTYIDFLRQVDGLGNGRVVMLINADGAVTGTLNILTGGIGSFKVIADVIEFVDPNGGNNLVPFYYGLDNKLYLDDVYIRKLDTGTVVSDNIAPQQVVESLVWEDSLGGVGGDSLGAGSTGAWAQFGLTGNKAEVTYPMLPAGGEVKLRMLINGSQSGSNDDVIRWRIKQIAPGGAVTYNPREIRASLLGSPQVLPWEWRQSINVAGPYTFQLEYYREVGSGFFYECQLLADAGKR